MILAGDTGGTKTVIALCDDAGKIVREAIFHCAEFSSLEAIIDRFLSPAESAQITSACFGVAGPVIDGTATITNLPWKISESVLSQRLGGARVRLLNDLQATALGALVLPPESFVYLQRGSLGTPTSTIGMIAPGTGLGEAMLVHDGVRYQALPSEAGHADFAAYTDDEIELLRFLRERYRGHVSYERVLCGRGIGDLYDFVRARSGAEPEWLSAAIASGDKNAVVAEAAIAKKDPACVRALEMFVEVLGAEAGNLALRSLATGGVVIGGGIPPKILPALESGALLARFIDKGRFSSWARSVDLRVAIEPRAALLGAAHEAFLLRSAG